LAVQVMKQILFQTFRQDSLTFELWAINLKLSCYT
jgi:hypothetical protein